MILGFKQYFNDGTPTFFKEKIKEGSKIHSLRQNDRWKMGMSIQMAYGVRTKNYEQFNKGIESLSTCISTQDVFMTYFCGQLEVTIGYDNYLYRNAIMTLIANDGLTESQFIKWFFPNDSDEWSGKIVHWTNYKYL